MDNRAARRTPSRRASRSPRFHRPSRAIPCHRPSSKAGPRRGSNRTLAVAGGHPPDLPLGHRAGHAQRQPGQHRAGGLGPVAEDLRAVPGRRTMTTGRERPRGSTSVSRGGLPTGARVGLRCRSGETGRSVAGRGIPTDGGVRPRSPCRERRLPQAIDDRAGGLERRGRPRGRDDRGGLPGTRPDGEFVVGPEHDAAPAGWNALPSWRSPAIRAEGPTWRPVSIGISRRATKPSARRIGANKSWRPVSGKTPWGLRTARRLRPWQTWRSGDHLGDVWPEPDPAGFIGVINRNLRGSPTPIPPSWAALRLIMVVEGPGPTFPR